SFAFCSGVRTASIWVLTAFIFAAAAWPSARTFRNAAPTAAESGFADAAAALRAARFAWAWARKAIPSVLCDAKISLTFVFWASVRSRIAIAARIPRPKWPRPPWFWARATQPASRRAGAVAAQGRHTQFLLKS